MCGLYGHIGNSSSLDKCLKGLKILEYRGYDSAGIAGVDNGNLVCFKEKGKISDLEKVLEKKLHTFQSSIGHTRWATHGSASKLNAHPHLCEKKEVAVVHNGIIENHRALRTMLEEKGVVFETETDSEVIAQLISHFYKGDLVEAVRACTALMKGFWGLAILHKNHPEQIVTTRLENPIVMGISQDGQEAFVSSDPHAFAQENLDLYFLDNHEIALISKNRIEIFDADAKVIEKTPEKLDLTQIAICKGNFEHFMHKEIHEQPSSIRNSILGRFVMEKGDAVFEDFSPSKSIKQILILGCGTSWHAGCIAAQQFEELAGIPARAEIASEYRYRKKSVDENTLVIALSQSGETFDTIAAVNRFKQEGAKVLAICNVHGSTLTRVADHTILLRAGPEISVCSTKAFSCLLSVLSLLALKFARLGPMNCEEGQRFLEEIVQLPTIVEAVLDQEHKIAKLADKYASHTNFFFLGRQYMASASLEAALKLKEISYLNAWAYPAGELKHGPIALIDSSFVIVALCGNKATYEKMLSNLNEVKTREGKILAMAPIELEEVEHIADDVLWLPHMRDDLSTIPYSIASQLLAYYIAKKLGTEIDQPRNLAKSVTVE
ncbi:MAG: Glutamine--fructose-6-phosphate aminotransferase [isomerizing] [Chlamydiae bacterium]|nr:Glutamine--fructose-6-phosphate aminotransferase [isomerizing] [Chlamydiota bacterium]